MRRPTDPLGAFRFRLELGSIDVAGFNYVEAGTPEQRLEGETA